MIAFSAALIALVLFALPIAIGLLLKKGGDLTFRQMHHAYLGCLLWLVGQALWTAWLPWLAFALILDDASEHWAQLLTGTLTLESMAHVLFYAGPGKLWPFTGLNRLLDAEAKKL
jgi:hypothetical protein